MKLSKRITVTLLIIVSFLLANKYVVEKHNSGFATRNVNQKLLTANSVVNIYFKDHVDHLEFEIGFKNDQERQLYTRNESKILDLFVKIIREEELIRDDIRENYESCFQIVIREYYETNKDVLEISRKMPSILPQITKYRYFSRELNETGNL